MKHTKESFHDTTESEMQALISAQEMTAALRSEMSQETTACDSWNSEVIRLTREVVKLSTKRIAGGNSLHYSSVPRPPPGMDCSQSFAPLEKVDSPLQTSRPADGNACERIPSTSTALSDTRSVAAESSSTRKEAEKFEIEP